MLGIALIGLFLRPSKLDRVIDHAIVWALHAAAVLLGRRQAYQAAGGFDTTRDMLDDVDLAFRVARIGETAKGFN